MTEASTTHLIPYITVRDPAAMRDFYVRAFGFVPQEQFKDAKGALAHVGMALDGLGVVMFSPEGEMVGRNMRAPASSGQDTPVSFYVHCADVNAIFARAKAAGATIMSEPVDMFWGDRMASLQDPDGYIWSFATYTGKTFDAPEGMTAV